MPVRTVRAVSLALDPKMSEASFQAKVLHLAHLFGWRTYHTHDSRRSNPGWPDVALWHPRRGQFVLAELKAQKGRVSPAQVTTLAELQQCGVDAYLWRPSDWPEIQALLTKGRPL